MTYLTADAYRTTYCPDISRDTLYRLLEEGRIEGAVDIGTGKRHRWHIPDGARILPAPTQRVVVAAATGSRQAPTQWSS